MAGGVFKNHGAEIWYYDFQLKGERYTGSTNHVNRKLAVTFVDDLKAKIRGELRDAAEGRKKVPAISCGDLFTLWLEHHTGAHQVRVKRDWRLHVLPALKSLKAMEVTADKLEEIRTSYLSKPSLRNAHLQEEILANRKKRKVEGELPVRQRTNSGANKLITHTQLVFSWAVATERLPRLPFRPLEALVEQGTKKTFLRLAQVDPFLEELDRLLNLHAMVAIRSMLYLGLREDEAIHLKWNGFDAGFLTYQALDTKTGEVVPLAVPDDLRDLLTQLRSHVDESCPWCLPSGQDEETGLWLPHVAQFTGKAIKRAGRKLGVTGISPHRMRGTMATLMARSGASAFVIKKAGRWARLETALKYVEIVEDDIKAAQDKAFGR